MTRQFIGLLIALGVGLLLALDMQSDAVLRDRAESAEAREDSAFVVHLDTKHALLDSLRARDERVAVLEVTTDSALAVADAGASRQDTVIRLIAVAAGPDSAATRRGAEAMRDSMMANEVVPLRVVVTSIMGALIEYQKSDAWWAEAYGIQGVALARSREEAAAWERVAKSNDLLGIHITPGMGFAAVVIVTLGTLLVIR